MSRCGLEENRTPNLRSMSALLYLIELQVPLIAALQRFELFTFGFEDLSDPLRAKKKTNLEWV